MTRTEERLTDALAQVAGLVREETLRPLASEPQGLRESHGQVGTAPGGGLPRRRRRRLMQLAPLAAGVAVLAVVGVLVGVARLNGSAPFPAFRDAATADSPPPFYVSIEGDGNRLVVRRTATGFRTDVVGAPRGWYATGKAAFYQGFEMSGLGVADDRLFVVSYTNPVLRRTALFRFGLTRSGKVTDFAQLPGGPLPGLVNPVVAVSPDGTQVAVAGTPPPRHLGDNPVESATVVVVNVLDGSRRTWQGGLNRPGQQFSIPSLSWTADGRSLIYVAQWCKPQLEIPDNATCQSEGSKPASGPVAQVRRLAVTVGGGSLGSGNVLLQGSARPPKIMQALALPDGDLAVVLRAHTHVSVVEFAVPGGHRVRVLYNGNYLSGFLVTLGLRSAELTADSSGRFLMLNTDMGVPHGWIHQGRFHWLTQETAPSIAW